jgi:hypothetical protein
VRFFLRSYGEITLVYFVRNSQARGWNPSARRWVPSGIDWSGIGGATEYDAATEDEAAEALLRLGVEADELPAVMIGLSPDSDLAKALRGE